MKIKTADNPMDLVKGEYHLGAKSYSDYVLSGDSLALFLRKKGAPLFAVRCIASKYSSAPESSNESDLDLQVSPRPHDKKWQVIVVKWRLSRKFYEAFYNEKIVNNENKNS